MSTPRKISMSLTPEEWQATALALSQFRLSPIANELVKKIEEKLK